MEINEKKLKKENSTIYRILMDEHDDDLEYVEECLSEHSDETAKDVLEKVNAIRKFFGNEEFTIQELKKELILDKL